MAYQFNHTAVAGTFDRLHAGHKALVKKAFDVAEHVSVGITSQEMVLEKQLHEIILPYEQRLHDVKAFISENGWFERTDFFELHDMYGPSLTDPSMDALVVSSKTVEGAVLVNQKRTQTGLAALSVVVAEYIESEDHSYLSSTRIRMGEIDREGKSYHTYLQNHSPFTLPDSLRDSLKSPLGDLISGTEVDLTIAVKSIEHAIAAAYKVCCVGDVVSYTILQYGYHPNVLVADNKNKRNITTHIFEPKEDFETVTVQNPPSTISKGSVDAIANIVKRIEETDVLQHLIVTGEEDLLVLPFILLLPLESIVLYGQLGEGIVMVKVTEAKKQEIFAFIQKWIP